MGGGVETAARGVGVGVASVGGTKEDCGVSVGVAGTVVVETGVGEETAAVGTGVEALSPQPTAREAMAKNANAADKLRRKRSVHILPVGDIRKVG